MVEKEFDIVIVGAGAAGYFAAATAIDFNPNLSICIVEKSNKVLSKVLISGGGRCNVTHFQHNNKKLGEAYPRGKQFLKSVFNVFAVKDTINWYQNANVELKTEEDGRMFPVSNNSESIVNALQSKIYNTELHLLQSIINIELTEQSFILSTQQGSKYLAKKVILACGGLSKISHFQFLKAFNLKIIDPVPSLFSFNIEDPQLQRLMGLSVPFASVKIISTEKKWDWFTGAILITHWGLSGPAILKASAWAARELYHCNYKFQILVNWIGQTEEELRIFWNEIKQTSKIISNLKLYSIPQRLWSYLLEKSDIDPAKRTNELNKTETNRLLENLIRSSFYVNYKTTYKEEFVTAGGLDLEQFNPSTMMCKSVPNLYACGEILDIDGITGGFNFQAAWSTAFIAGKSAALEM